MKSCSVFHIEQKMEFEKFNCFFIDFLRYSFGRIKVISTVVEKDYTPDITLQICFAYQLTGFYMVRGFTERYFLTDYIYILENHFYFMNVSGYCFKFSPQYEGPLTHIFRTSLLCTFFIYKKKQIGFLAKFFFKYFFRPKVIPNYMSSKFPDPGIKLN